MSFTRFGEGNRFEKGRFWPGSSSDSSEPILSQTTEYHQVPPKSRLVLPAESLEALERARWATTKGPNLMLLAKLYWEIRVQGRTFFAVAARKLGDDFQICGFETGCGWQVYLLSALQAVGAKSDDTFRPISAITLKRMYSATYI